MPWEIITCVIVAGASILTTVVRTTGGESIGQLRGELHGFREDVNRRLDKIERRVGLNGIGGTRGS